MTFLEFFASICGLLYLGLISFHIRNGWIFGCLSSAIYIYLCSEQELYIQATLQFLYVILGVIGYFNWDSHNKINIERISFKNHIGLILIGSILSILLGKIMTLSNQQFAYLDAGVSVFAVIATILATKSILENWFYWFFVNLLSIFLFAIKEMPITVILYCIYFLGSIFGYFSWNNLFKRNLQNKRPNEN